MKKFMVPAILLSAMMAGTSYGGGLFADDDGAAEPSNRYPVAWANRYDSNPAQYAGYPGYAGYVGFAAPMYMSSWGHSPCGPDCDSVWAGYKTCHQGKGWGGGCGCGGCGFSGGCGCNGACNRGCGGGHGGFGHCGGGCDTCAPKAVGCNPCCGPKFKFDFDCFKCKPKCKAKTCRPKCDKCCGQGFGGRPRCGCGSCCGFNACGGCGAWSGGCDYSGHDAEYYESMPSDAGHDAEQIEAAPAEDVPVPPLEARLWRPLSTLSGMLPVNFSPQD